MRRAHCVPKTERNYNRALFCLDLHFSFCFTCVSLCSDILRVGLHICPYRPAEAENKECWDFAD